MNPTPVRRTNSVRPAALMLGALLATSAASFAPRADAAPAQKKFPTPAGRIVYKMSGFMGMSGTMTMTWTANGQKFRQDTAMSMPAMPGGKMNTWTISDGKAVYVSGPMMGKKVMRMKMMPQMAGGMTGGGMPGMNMSAGAGGGKLVGRATVLGKPCEIRLVTANTPQMDMRMKMWMWRGMPLKMENSMKMKSAPRGASGNTPKIPNVNITMTATRLDLNPKLSPAMFKVPAGYTIQDAPAAGARGMTRR